MGWQWKTVARKQQWEFDRLKSFTMPLSVMRTQWFVVWCCSWCYIDKLMFCIHISHMKRYWISIVSIGKYWFSFNFISETVTSEDNFSKICLVSRKQGISVVLLWGRARRGWLSTPVWRQHISDICDRRSNFSHFSERQCANHLANHAAHIETHFILVKHRQQSNLGA